MSCKAVFFLLMGCINLYVAFNFSVDTWVSFKLFGATGLMLVFIILQVLMLEKYLKDTSQILTASTSDNAVEKIENKASKE